MKITILETEHFEAAYPLVRLFDNGRNEITIFSYPQSYDQLRYLLGNNTNNYEWIKKGEKQSKISFIYRIFRQTKKKKIDLLYLGTVTDNFIFYALLIFCLRKVRIILTVHAINTFFETKKRGNLRRMIRALGKKLLRNVTNEYNVLSESMVPCLRKKLPAGKKIHCIPGGIFEEANYNPGQVLLHQPISIVIPGSIDGKRRDYGKAFELLSLLQKENIPVTMTFLGAFHGEYGERIEKTCKEWNEIYKNLVYYTDTTIDQPEFDRILQSAAFLYIPSVINTIIDDGVEEVYGISISSGNFSDVIRHAKPFIIPQQLQIDATLEKAAIRYFSTQDIVVFLASLRNDTGKYNKLAKDAYEVSQHYTLEKVKKRNEAIFK